MECNCMCISLIIFSPNFNIMWCKWYVYWKRKVCTFLTHILLLNAEMLCSAITGQCVWLVHCSNTSYDLKKNSFSINTVRNNLQCSTLKEFIVESVSSSSQQIEYKWVNHARSCLPTLKKQLYQKKLFDVFLWNCEILWTNSLCFSYLSII